MKKSLSRSLIVVVVVWGLTASLLIAACCGKSNAKMAKESLRGKLSDPNTIVLDVRTAKAWEKCDSKITGALREDPGKVSTWSKKYPKEKTIVLYCSCDNDATSSRVVGELRETGFTQAYVLSGGWREWIEADFPTEKK